MKWLIRACLPCLALALAVAAPASAETQVEEGKANVTPWSGYWWPIVDGQLHKGPLTKYDQITDKHAAAWEREHNPQQGAKNWYGYCHAWSSASIMEKEPRKVSEAQSSAAHGGGKVPLGVGDQKGLLTACHTEDLANTYGERNDGDGDPQDIYPDELWRLLKLYVKQQKVPLVLDIDPGPEVWNFPVYAYRVEYAPTGNGNEHTGTMTLWMADDGVAPDFLGTKVAKHTYQFRFQMTASNSVIAGSARWTGPSEKDHPDFAWYPYVARAENPEVDYDTVKKLVDAGGSAPPPPIDDPDNPPQPRPVPPGERVIALSPLELLALVTNKPSNLDVDVKVDKFSGGEYTLGEQFTVNLATEKDGYLYLFYLEGQGGVHLLFPQPNQDNRVKKADGRITLPGPKDGFTFQTVGAPGTHRVLAVVTTRPLLLTGLNDQKPRWPGQDDRGGPVQGQQKQKVQRFDLPRPQQQHTQQVVRQYVQKPDQKVKPEDVGNVKPKDVLKEFGQGDVAFYVGPAKKKDKDKDQPKTEK